MKLHCLLGSTALVIVKALATSVSFSQSSTLPADTPTVVNGVESVCTGVGEKNRNSPRWANYPVKVELVGKGGEYLGAEQITVSHKGTSLVGVNCGGPWALFRFQPGRYVVSATTGGETRARVLLAPTEGQGRIILHF